MIFMCLLAVLMYLSARDNTFRIKQCETNVQYLAVFVRYFQIKLYAASKLRFTWIVCFISSSTIFAIQIVALVADSDKEINSVKTKEQV